MTIDTSVTPIQQERQPLRQAIRVPALAIVTALLTGAIIMALSGDNPLVAYWGLLRGAVGDAAAISRTIRKACPLILTGLSVAFAFKAGLFNIGASGQFLIGTVCSVAVGLSFDGLPPAIHMPLALLAGAVGGALWGAIPGALKVWRGSHEVITTIMLNYVASQFVGWTVYAGGTQGQRPGPLSDPQAASYGISETRDVLASARIPALFPEVLDRAHWGIFIAILAAVVIWWILNRAVLGYEVRTVGRNQDAARYAGMRVNRLVVLTMAVAGALAGMAGAIETLGLNFKFAPEFTGSAGFEGITVALLGKVHPLGVVLSSFLIGALDAGSAKMQFVSGVDVQIIQVVQALVLAFVAAPEIIRRIYRLKESAASPPVPFVAEGAETAPDASPEEDSHAG
jgi:general nucleoside transport system permease protein